MMVDYLQAVLIYAILWNPSLSSQETRKGIWNINWYWGWHDLKPTIMSDIELPWQNHCVVPINKVCDLINTPEYEWRLCVLPQWIQLKTQIAMYTVENPDGSLK